MSRVSLERVVRPRSSAWLDRVVIKARWHDTQPSSGRIICHPAIKNAHARSFFYSDRAAVLNIRARLVIGFVE
jgi:hypothetical protein